MKQSEMIQIVGMDRITRRFVSNSTLKFVVALHAQDFRRRLDRAARAVH